MLYKYHGLSLYESMKFMGERMIVSMNEDRDPQRQADFLRKIS